jgi:hypothetical protein
MVLVRYRDAGMATCTWFYVNENKHMVSPFFDSESEAKAWFSQVFEGEEEVVIAV